MVLLKSEGVKKNMEQAELFDIKLDTTKPADKKPKVYGVPHRANLFEIQQLLEKKYGPNWYCEDPRNNGKRRRKKHRRGR